MTFVGTASTTIAPAHLPPIRCWIDDLITIDNMAPAPFIGGATMAFGLAASNGPRDLPGNSETKSDDIGGFGEIIDSFRTLCTTTTTVLTTAPTTPPSARSTHVGASASDAELIRVLSAASSAGYARLSSMQAAQQAWQVPARPELVAVATNARTSGLKSDGVTDNTAALQSILNALPVGATLYFPAGNYRIDGPIRIPKLVTLVGESGTIFDCSRATQYVFTINRGGSPIGGMTITGLVIEGPGVETNPAMIDAYNLQNFHVSYVKFHNVGYAAIRINTCTDAIIEDCIFDNVFQKGYGYGVCICELCDRILIRDNFFVTKGRHSVTTGTSQTYLPAADYIRQVIFENNYCEKTTDRAADTHAQTVGPFIVRNNVFYKCYGGVGIRGGLTEISDNMMVECTYGVSGYDRNAKPIMTDSWISTMLRNTIINTHGDGITVRYMNAMMQDNIITSATGITGTIGVYVMDGEYPSAHLTIERTVIDGFKNGIIIEKPNPGIFLSNNYRRSDQKFQTV